MEGIDAVRSELAYMYETNDWVEDPQARPGFQRFIELIGCSFLITDDHIFGSVNHDYVKRELEWYESQSLSVHSIPGKTPDVWLAVASEFGYINSNYGHLIWSEANGEQYKHVLNELRQRPTSRRAVMIYQRPSMWFDYNKHGMSDFICTNAVQYLIRKDKQLATVVQMRSNDVIFGFKNDVHWQAHVACKLADELGVNPGPMVWNAGSLHVYEKDWYLLHHYCNTGETSITKKSFKDLYPNSGLML